MQLTFWGAARTVTGSMHLLTLNDGRRLLMDCGLYQGRRATANQINREFPAPPAEIDAVLLSHAHIDHSGLLPRLYRQGFRGRVWCTHATASLCSLMLLDSAHIQEKDVEFVNRRNKKKGRPPIQPLYVTSDVEEVLNLFIGVAYCTPFSPLPGVSVEYRDAGHILGSASMVITVEEEGRSKKLGFTGDVGRPGRMIIRDPQPMPDCDWLISESTYGGHHHDPPDEARKTLADTIGRTAARGGKVLIPSFAVGRTQEIVHTLDQLWNEGRLPPTPVFVDSPLAVNVTGVYQSHPECYDAELLRYMMEDDDPFGFSRLEYVRNVERSKALNAAHGPMVVIAASGMCEAGRILHHLRNNISDPRTTVLMVGYCADHTLGKRLIEKRDEVRIFGEPHKRRAEVVVMNSYSAHADQPELLSFIGRLDRDRLQEIFLVHGAPQRQEALEEALTAQGYRKLRRPERREKVTL